MPVLKKEKVLRSESKQRIWRWGSFKLNSFWYCSEAVLRLLKMSAWTFRQGSRGNSSRYISSTNNTSGCSWIHCPTLALQFRSTRTCGHPSLSWAGRSQCSHAAKYLGCLGHVPTSFRAWIATYPEQCGPQRNWHSCAIGWNRKIFWQWQQEFINDFHFIPIHWIKK